MFDYIFSTLYAMVHCNVEYNGSHDWSLDKGITVAMRFRTNTDAEKRLTALK